MGVAKPMTNRDRLLSVLPRDKHLLVSRACDAHGFEDDDPLFLLLLEVIEAQRRAEGYTQNFHSVIGQISHPKTWRKLLFHRVLAWLIIPLVLAGSLFAALYSVHQIAYEQSDRLTSQVETLSENVELIKTINKDISKLGKDVEGATAYAERTRDLGLTANRSAKMIMAISALLNTPGAEARIGQSGLELTIPEQDVDVEVTKDKATGTKKIFIVFRNGTAYFPHNVEFFDSMVEADQRRGEMLRGER